MAKKAMDAYEKRHIEKIKKHGCIIDDCRKWPAEAHHIREGAGMGQKSAHWLTIPLCAECHRGDFSIHKSKRQFENIYGTELDLLAKTMREIYGV